MELFPLAIFPQGSLSSSIIPVVWVGMSLVCFFNLRLGWVLSGLVVPGYLVPLILIKPWAASVVLLESFLTYFLVWFLSEYLSRWAHWCNFFGRDRFFALVLCSILVRLVFDGWLLPELGAWAAGHWQIAFDYRNNLHSFGLIIVSLIANQFWKTGFFKGLIPLFTTLALTFLIVRFGLMELTNFNLSSISYLYEDMATSILATPKAYIIVVSTAFLASRMNLHYGWDFNGILIPSLLALQWYQPIKILATIIESSIILGLAILLLKTPLLNKTTIEGARKLLLFFNISFAYKMLLAYAILAWFPELKVTDYFGFGYLLSTLMAVKIHDKAIFARLTRATLETSLMAVVFANLVGFTLTRLPLPKLFDEADIAELPANQATQVPTAKQELDLLLRQDEVALYQSKLANQFVPPLAAEIDIFSTALSHIQVYLETQDEHALQEAAFYLQKLNYRLERPNNGRYLYLREQAPIRGWGIYIFDTQAQSELALEMPAPLEEPGIFDAGIGLFNSFANRSLAISGSNHNKDYAEETTDVLKNQRSFFQVFHHTINRHNCLQLRAYNPEMAREVAGARINQKSLDINGLNSSLWIKEHLPDSLGLAKLKQLLDSFQIYWTEPPFPNQQREASRYGFAELVLTQEDLRKVLFSPLLFTLKSTVHTVEETLTIEGYLQEWVLNRKQTIAPKGSQLYQPPKPEQLLFFDEQILTPLLKIISQIAVAPDDMSAYDEELRKISQAADIADYQLIKYRNGLTGQNYLVLAEKDGQQLKHSGIYVFRLGKSSPYAVQIPRPLIEINSFEYGVSLFERLDAQALMVGTTHPKANFDGSADLGNPENKASLFNLVSQVLIREAHDAELAIISSRAYAYRPDRPIPDADIVFSPLEGVVARGHLGRLEKELLGKLESDGMSVQLIDGSDQTSGYEVGNTAQALYLSASTNKSFVILWLSPNARSGFRQQSENLIQAEQFANFKITGIEHDLGLYLQQHRAFSQKTRLDGSFQSLLSQYIVEQDVLRLQQVVGSAENCRYSLLRLIDRNSKQSFLLINDSHGIPLAVANLSTKNQDAVYADLTLPISVQAADFIDRRKAWWLGQAN